MRKTVDLSTERIRKATNEEAAKINFLPRLRTRGKYTDDSTADEIARILQEDSKATVLVIDMPDMITRSAQLKIHLRERGFDVATREAVFAYGQHSDPPTLAVRVVRPEDRAGQKTKQDEPSVRNEVVNWKP